MGLPAQLRPIAGVADVILLCGAAAAPEAQPALLCEVAHGATEAGHYASLRAALRGDYPDELRDFFFVNTDVGAPELALATARAFVLRVPDRCALVVRCLVPRTFIDCNRNIDDDALAGGGGAGAITPGLHAWVREPADRTLLLERHRRYRELARAAFAAVCGQGGTGLMVHSYAPRSIDVPVDDRIVERLRAEYGPDRIGTWPLRPMVDLIARDPDGAEPGDAALRARVQAAFTGAGIECTVNGTYPLHPVTLAHRFAVAHPGRTLCLEVRRDLLVPEFRPFVPLAADPERIAPLAELLAGAVAAWAGQRG